MRRSFVALVVAVGGASALCGLALGTASASSLVVNGDFSAGDTGFFSDYQDLTGGFIPGPGGYSVTPADNVYFSGGAPDWTTVPTDPSGGNGNVLVADGATTPNTRVWYQSVNVAPNTLYTFSFYGADVNTDPTSNATIQARINGNVIGTLDTTNGWLFASFMWFSGSNTSADLSLVDTNTAYYYNDLAVDDISLTSATPIPAALPLFATGLGGLGLLGWRRKRRAQAVA
jgi:hypothetical protein